MTVNPETNFWKSLKKLLETGHHKYLISRLESYVTPGFPDCLVFNKDTGFFTLELKVIQSNNKLKISPFQYAWNSLPSSLGAPVFILATALDGRYVKLFSGSVMRDLRSYFFLFLTILCRYFGDILNSFATGFFFDRKNSLIAFFFKFSI